jgi:phosphoenolpyruvate synthase/pyruvate phosphate dikinase
MKWVHFLHRDMSVLFDYFAQRAGVEYLEETLELPGFQLKGRKIDHSEIYHDESEIDEFRRRVDARGQNYLEFLADACAAQCDRLVQTAKQSKDKSPIEAFDKYCIGQMKLMTFLPLFPGVIEPIISRQLDDLVQRYATQDMPAEKLMQTLQKPTKRYTVMREEMAKYKIGEQIQQNPEASAAFMTSNEGGRTVLAEDVPLQTAIQNHIDEFGWMETRHFKGRLWTVDDVIERLRSVLGSDCSALYRQAEQNLAQQEEEIRSVYHQLGFSRKDKDTIRTIREFIYLRTQRKDSMSEATYHIQWALEEIAQNAGLEASDLVYLMPKEIRELGTNPDQASMYREEIGKRKKGFALITYDGETGLFTDEFEVSCYQETNKDRRVVGISTFPGEVIAPARRVMQKSEIESTKHGEIMVTPTTSPDYVVIIDRMAGIVTNEGGVTSHAAQISREYCIPCIIGTGNATKVFNTGDKIYLNANRGFAEVKQNE